MKAFFATAVLMPFAAIAAGPFDGTWKTDPATLQVTGKPEVYELKEGMFQCSSCVPPYSVKADGTDQPTRNPYYDTVAVRVVDAHTVEIAHKLQGKPTFDVSMKVSADGATLAESFRDVTGAQAATGTQVAKRVGMVPAGAHAVSGHWKIDKMPELSDVATTVSYKMTADGFQMSWNGQSYDAKFDGKKYPVTNDPGKTWVSLKRISASKVQETDLREGKVTDVYVLTVGDDGKTMSVVDQDKQHGTTMRYTMIKQ
jgi:hypothetical protein